MKKSWYEIRDATDGIVEVLLYDEIGSWGISAKDFVNDLQRIKAKMINLRINSPGGDVFDGVAIFNALKRHPASVDVVVDGLAASSASFITQAGDTVLMATGSTMMIHEPHGMTLGDAKDHAKMAETLNKMGDTVASFYAARANGTEAEWRERMREESWYRAQEAVDVGLADGIVDGQRARNQVGIFNLSNFKNVPEWVPQAKIENPYPQEGETKADFMRRCNNDPAMRENHPDAAEREAACERHWERSHPPEDTIRNPYPNEHACRLRDPGDFQPDSFRRMSREHEGKRYDVIVGRLKGESSATEQAYRYPKDTWTPDTARSHCKDHDGSFEAASGEAKACEPTDKELGLNDPFAEVDWPTLFKDYANFNPPEPNLEKLLAEHPIEKALEAGVASLKREE